MTLIYDCTGGNFCPLTQESNHGEIRKTADEQCRNFQRPQT